MAWRFERLGSRITNLASWRDGDKCILASGLTLPFVAVWIVRLTLVEHHPAYFFPDLYSRRIASMIPDCRMEVFSGADGEFIIDLGIAAAFLRGE